MKIALLLMMLTCGFTFAAAPATQKAQPVNKICPVGEQEVNPKGQTVEYKGKVIGFCCDECIPEFKKDPERYMKNLK